MLSALFSISDVHFCMMKGMPSGLFLAACVKSMPKRCSLPWSFLCPHWMAKVSRHFLWQAREHCRTNAAHSQLPIQSNPIPDLFFSFFYQKQRASRYLLALGPVKHHQAVALAALGRRSQLPQLVRLGSLGHVGVPEGARRAGRFDQDLVGTCGNGTEARTRQRGGSTEVPKLRVLLKVSFTHWTLGWILMCSSLPMSEGEGGSLSSKSSAEDIVPVEGVRGKRLLKSPGQ